MAAGVQRVSMGIDLRRTSHVVWFILILPSLSVLLAWVSFHVVAHVTWSGAFIIDGVGVLGAYSLLYQAFDHYAWRWRLFRTLGVVEAPLMAGRWRGDLATSREGTGPISAVVEIEQAFSHVKVCMYFPQSRSFSLMTQFVTNAHGVLALHYEYQNSPGADASATMYTHYGTARLECIPGKQRLEGEYYNRGRDDRGNVGAMTLVWQGSQLLRRFEE